MAVAAFLLVWCLDLFSELAGRGGGGSPAWDGHLGDLRNGSNRADQCHPSSSAECGPYSTGWRSFGRTRCHREERWREDELLATIADETTARQLKQARADLRAATQRAELPLPSAEALKVAEDNLSRLEKLTSLSNVPAVEYEGKPSEVNRLRGLLESEGIQRDRNLAMLDDACKKLEAQMKNSEIRSPIDGLLTAIKVIDGELVADRCGAIHDFVAKKLCARRS